jgi:hypothetical protein
MHLFAEAELLAVEGDRGEQLDGERVEVDLLARAGRRMLPRCGRRRSGG